MAFAITQTCCNDASCVSVCPVNCIHPTPDEPDFGTTEMLYVDPRTCIDCGACADACPVDAIFPVDRLMGPDRVYAELNRQYYDTHDVIDTEDTEDTGSAGNTDNAWGKPRFPRSLPHEVGTLRIAVVGTGPAASYAAQSLLRTTGAEVTMIDRMPVPGGLVRFGVAPDHPSTKKVGDSFAALYRHPRLNLQLNVDVGTDVTHAEIMAHHHAVIYAVGAANDRTLGVPGEDKAGSISATEFVGWYNSHPDIDPDAVDLSATRAVVVGNGNVALDVARILVTDPDRLAATDIADHALAALRRSRVREVVVLGRRGPGQAAFTRPEFLALRQLPGVDVVVDDHVDAGRAAIASAGPGSKAALFGDVPLVKVDWSAPPPEGRRIVFRFRSAPSALCGDERVDSVRVVRDAGSGQESHVDALRAGLVIRSIGYRSAPVPDLPFDEATDTVPHKAGRVTTTVTGEHLPGTYVVGWVKRGPSGGIGANRTCSAETVDSLLDDAAAGRLPEPAGSAREFARLVRRRQPDALGRREMLAIDRAERRRGVESGLDRPRVKFATVPDLLRAGRRFGGR
ncbi:ferredoxin--NADP+ reductase [Amycolatopsis marina]|uniref:ferredoxin--NADP(+) reductase n=1 Tax=Amycolatopsis marina TaxID=490629 RepID=A0A1I1AYL8_9PSEU|nr:FAD-dependent oxidoreductase [Amycolatopsis marina]SFB41460.1 ferredoxin--NADP+ reductase [Amycolatopsis marina]